MSNKELEYKIVLTLKEKIIMSTIELQKEFFETKNLNVTLNRMKKKKLISNISRGYYVVESVYEDPNKFQLAVEKIYTIDNMGYYTGMHLLNSYGFLDQVPFVKTFKSTSQAHIDNNTIYKVERLDGRLRNEEKWMLELYEIIKQLKNYGIDIDYLKVIKKVMKKYNLKTEDLSRLKIITFEYYHESRKVMNRIEKIIKKI